MDKYDRFRMHTHAEHKLIILSVHYHHQFYCVAIPLLVPTTPLPLPSKKLIPKLNFRARTGIPFLIKQALDLLHRLIRSFYVTLNFTTTTDTPFHVNPSPNLS